MSKLLSAFLVLTMTTSAAWGQSDGSHETKPSTAHAIFAGGCFWCTEAAFDGTPGVLSVTSGYTGGHVPNPTYEQVSTGTTGHFEAVRVEYDPAKISYQQLLDIFWQNIDPTDSLGQFYDQGSQYHTAIFCENEMQKQAALASRDRVASRLEPDKKIATEILDIAPFYPAEEYHQHYHDKNPQRYNAYKLGSGREKKLQQLWGESKKQSEP